MKEQLRPYLAFLILGALASIAEYLFPARQLNYRSVFPKDLVALGTYTVCFAMVIPFIDHIPILNYVPACLLQISIAFRLLLFYLIEDFTLYWVHRLMHTKQFWRTHKWHHLPSYFYWLAGIRFSVPHIILFNFAFVVARPLLANAPGWVFQLVAMEHIFRNIWVHMNVPWGSSWLEWLVVTPRYHQIHHSSEHYTNNLGSLLTVWDRLFGTYCVLDRVKNELTFGLKERLHPVRLVLGI
jgi:sterol desaturase/sphingolipid hydroxylase (fatty acid hydroxylase superfamily)